jgi:hypothetical protein
VRPHGDHLVERRDHERVPNFNQAARVTREGNLDGAGQARIAAHTDVGRAIQARHASSLGARALGQSVARDRRVVDLGQPGHVVGVSIAACDQALATAAPRHTHRAHHRDAKLRPEATKPIHGSHAARYIPPKSTRAYGALGDDVAPGRARSRRSENTLASSTLSTHAKEASSASACLR